MKRISTLTALLIVPALLFAASGGPDQYGYLWKDSAEPDGPVYDWIDITNTGAPVLGLADDNVIGPFVMALNMPFYWYEQKLIWFGSNGYVAFASGNIAAAFPPIPQGGGTENYIAPYMTDLTFAGAGNPGQCFILDEGVRTIISYINVPFWNVLSPGYSGSNTFQIILDRADSTITFQYQNVTGFSSSNGPIVGIESLTGAIGLQSSSGVYPAANYAVRFYNPPVPLLTVRDAAVDWVGVEGTGGIATTIGASIPLSARVQNSGNEQLPGFTVTSRILNASNQVLLSEALEQGALDPAQSTILDYTNPFVPATAGTFRNEVTISGVTNELVASNNSVSREVVVYDPAALSTLVDWAGPTDDFIGIGWNGGDGGAGMYILPPFYPCQVTGTTIRLASNGGSNFTMKVYDDDGPDGGPGTLLDSVYVTAANGAAGDHVYPLNDNIDLTEGGLYVEWYMQGAFVNIAQDIVPPFSLRSYEVLSGVWAEYRDRDIADFHLGLRVEQAPFHDAGSNGLVGLTNGQIVSQPTQVTTIIRNFGNLNLSNVPVNYQFNNGPIVTQNYSGPTITPGVSAVFSFAQLLQPSNTATGDLCVWTSYPDDTHVNNDSTCIELQVIAGIAEQTAVELSMSPNPANDRLSIRGLPNGRVAYEVLDARGAVAAHGVLTGRAGSVQLSATELENGVYVIRARYGDGTAVGRFVVQH